MSTGRFVPPPVYIGFPLFVLAKRRSKQSFAVPWELEGRLPSGPTEMSAPWFAQLRPAPPSAVRCADPTRPLCVRVLDSTGKCFVIVHDYRRAAYTSEPTNAEAPIWAAYWQPIECTELGDFRITTSSNALIPREHGSATDAKSAPKRSPFSCVRTFLRKDVLSVACVA